MNLSNIKDIVHLNNISDAVHLFSAVGHPTRLRILVVFANRSEWSPKRMTDALPHQEGSGALKLESLGNVSYHFRVLEKAGLIRPTRQRPVRGASEHFYRITARGRRALGVLDHGPSQGK